MRSQGLPRRTIEKIWSHPDTVASESKVVHVVVLLFVGKFCLVVMSGDRLLCHTRSSVCWETSSAEHAVFKNICTHIEHLQVVST